MKKIFTILLFLSVLIVQAENYKKVRIYADNNHYSTVVSCGIDLSDAFFNKNNTVNVFVTDAEYEKLLQNGVKMDVIIDNWNKYYTNLPKLTTDEKNSFLLESDEKYGVKGFGLGSMGGYYTMSEIYAKLDSMRILYPNLISAKYVIGYTYENRPIYAVKISDNPDVDENEPEVFYNSLIHCREPAAMMTVMYYMYYLLENYGTNPEATYLVNNREIYFVPLINVDGYEYNRSTNPSGGGMWRKNRHPYSGGVGVDLNRNFGYKWAYDNNGSSNYVDDETYRGPSAFSEPETEAFRQFCNGRTFKTTFNYHTYSNYLLYAWSYDLIPTPDSSLFLEYAMDMVKYNGFEYGQPPALLYEVNGCTDDWMYGEQIEKPKIISFTPEVGDDNDGFWPSQNRIYPIAQENLKPNLYLTWVAGDYVSVTGANYSSQYFNPGDQNVALNLIVKNKGLSDASGVSVTITSLNPDVNFAVSTINYNNIPARTEVESSSPFIFNVGNSLSAGTKVNFEVKTFSNTVQMATDTLSIIIGTPIYAFVDQNNDPAVLWNITASPTTPKWEATTATYYSSSTSYTDSKTGTYSSNATVTMTTKDPINLAILNNPVLSFWTKYEIEDEWDCGKVQLSTNNGTTWISLAGQYTSAGSGKGTQTPTGTPIYDATQNTWVNETIDLSMYANSQIKLRFELKSDGSVEKDGWYIDDIGIFSYAVVPVELTSFVGNIAADNVLLSWTTATETNNNGFYVEKSLDGHSWNNIGFVNGAGTTTEIHNYNYVDNNPNTGLNYYRLTQVDYDGSKVVIAPIKVNYTGIITFNLEQNYPNPFNPSTTIKFQIPTNELVQIKLFDILGNEVATLVNEQMEMGNHSVEFNSAKYNNIASGTYFYTIKAGKYSATKKLMLLK